MGYSESDGKRMQKILCLKKDMRKVGFGLPMAFLQHKRNLETAITFHWFIDFIRFFGGYW